jgi:hypothetical protein
MDAWSDIDVDGLPPLRTADHLVHPIVARYAPCGDFICVATKREVRPLTDDQCPRTSVLNALRTVVPAFGTLVLGSAVFPLIIYDFYFRGHTLHMVLINLSTLHVFDAFAFEYDIMHMLIRCRTVLPPSTHIPTYTRSFRNYHIYAKDQRRGSCNLERGICASARKGYRSTMLRQWLEPGPFITEMQSMFVPSTYCPITLACATDLSSSTTARTTSPCSTTCVCESVLRKYHDDRCAGRLHEDEPFPFSCITATLTSDVSPTHAHVFKASIAELRRVYIAQNQTSSH